MSRLLAANLTRLKKSHAFLAEIIFMILFGVYEPIVRYINGKKSGEIVPLDNGFFLCVALLLILAAVLCSLYIGTEYSDGTIRNKVIVGRRRTAVYLANLVACALAAPAAVLAAPGEAHAAPKISAKSKTLAAGKSFALKVKGEKGKIKWSSTNRKVATVTSKGKVKAKKAGTATVTARIGGKKVASCKVTVRKGASAHVHSWKKVLVKEAWEEPVYGYVDVCACGKVFKTASEVADHRGAEYVKVSDSTIGLPKEEADKILANAQAHNSSVQKRQTGTVSHPAQYAYKCACGAVK